MSITHNTSVRTGFAADVNTALTTGSDLVLLAGVAVVSTIPLNDPVFTQAAAVLTADVNPIPEDPSAVGNVSVVDSMEFRDGSNAAVFTGDNITGIAGGGDLELSKNPIDPGDVVQLTSFTYTASV
jgi:hypothetical protein